MESLGIRSSEKQKLIDSMDIAQKRIWLNRRLFRVSQSKQLPKKKKMKKKSVVQEDGTIKIVEEEVTVNAETPLAFIECDRKENIIRVFNKQRENTTGLWDDLSGQIEVRFVGEGSSGSAVLREFITHASESLLSKENNLLKSLDGGRTYFPSTSCIPAELHVLHMRT